MTTMNDNENKREELSQLNHQMECAYIAGMVDSHSTLHAPIVKDERDYRLGYRIYAEIQMTRPLPFALQMIDDFCMDYGIRCSLKQKGDRYYLRILNSKDIQFFLKKIAPFLRDRREEAEQLSEVIIPKIEDGYHLEEETFMELVSDIESLREMNPRTEGSKYNLEYFEEEFDLEQ